jgi:NAD(P)-dependent dehydrogenase (short-subunit alcohol dehydrogenase family)
MTDLKGRTALVTGSTSGIGKATALALAGRGAHVLVVGRNEQRAEQVVAEIEGSGGRASFRLATLGDLQSARELVEWATEAGDGHVDILINNAGVSLFGPTNAATEAEFDETFALNVKVPFFLVASLAPAMAERGWGSIVNISTMVASFGQAGMAMYGASRAALELLTKAWAAEYGGRGVRVNAVAPGPTRTPTTRAASTTACPGAPERASGPVIVIGLLLHVPGTGCARRGRGRPPRASKRSACRRLAGRPAGPGLGGAARSGTAGWRGSRCNAAAAG